MKWPNVMMTSDGVNTHTVYGARVMTVIHLDMQGRVRQAIPVQRCSCINTTLHNTTQGNDLSLEGKERLCLW